MTKEAMKVIAEKGLATARRDLQNTGRVDVAIALEIDGQLKRLPSMPTLMNEVMNNGAMKERFFGAIRKAAQDLKATAVMMVTDAWMGEPTEKQKGMTPEEIKAACRGKNVRELAAEGLVTRCEAVVVTVQTPTETFILTQVYERVGDAIEFGKRTERFGDEESFQGRQKMYGAESEL